MRWEMATETRVYCVLFERNNAKDTESYTDFRWEETITKTLLHFYTILNRFVKSCICWFFHKTHFSSALLKFPAGLSRQAILCWFALLMFALECLLLCYYASGAICLHACMRLHTHFMASKFNFVETGSRSASRREMPMPMCWWPQRTTTNNNNEKQLNYHAG